MICLLVAVVIISLASIPAHTQQAGTSASAASATSTHQVPEYPDKPEALRRIALYEAAARQMESSPHPVGADLVRIYRQLGNLYECAGMYPKAEEAMRHAVALLRNGPQDQLASEMSELALLHTAMGQTHESEKEELEALRIRERVGDASGRALSWSELGGLYVKKRNFKKAADFAQRALAVLADDPKVDPIDRIAVRQTLGVALCELKDCARGISTLKEAVELAKTTFGPDSMAVGIAGFLLGTAYWRSGDMVTAADQLSQGTAKMKATLGWGHPSYVAAMTKYARFLRLRGDVEAAAAAEREVRQANAVVDVRALTADANAFAGAAPH